LHSLSKAKTFLYNLVTHLNNWSICVLYFLYSWLREGIVHATCSIVWLENVGARRDLWSNTLAFCTLQIWYNAAATMAYVMCFCFWVPFVLFRTLKKESYLGLKWGIGHRDESKYHNSFAQQQERNRCSGISPSSLHRPHNSSPVWLVNLASLCFAGALCWKNNHAVNVCLGSMVLFLIIEFHGW